MSHCGSPTLQRTSTLYSDWKSTDDELCGDERWVTLLVQNHGTEKQYLMKGFQLGVAFPVDVLTGADEGESTDVHREISRLQQSDSTLC